MKLEPKPKFWEDRINLYFAYLIKTGVKSTTLRCYLSAMKSILKTDGYPWDNGKMLLTIIVRACRIRNDGVKTKLPIHLGLLEILLFKIEHLYKDSQPYLCNLFKAIFCMSYYGLMHIGEVTLGQHALQAKNIHITSNKNKIMMILYMSKTHNISSHPLKIKISEIGDTGGTQHVVKWAFFCPFSVICEYIRIRGGYASEQEQFFIFTDKSPVTQSCLRNLLVKLLKKLNLNWKAYTFHSMRLGRASDLLKMGMPIEHIKQAGHWKSNAVYKYLRL